MGALEREGGGRDLTTTPGRHSRKLPSFSESVHDRRAEDHLNRIFLASQAVVLTRNAPIVVSGQKLAQIMPVSRAGSAE